MKDLHINIGGPRDHARQQVSFRIAQEGDRTGFDVEQVTNLVGQLRGELERCQLSDDQRRRIQRHLTTIEEEAASEEPILSEISDAVTFVGKLVETAQGIVPLFASTFHLLATAVGVPLTR